jgi:hypothetical protein
MHRTTRHDRRLAAGLIKGALAGAVATWAMGKVTTWLYDSESDAVRQREDAARTGKSAYVVAAQKAADFAGVALTDDEQQRAGIGIHWALGISAGAVYGALRSRFPATAAMNGLPFGAGMFLLLDELMNPVLGLTPGPAAFPWQTHARGLGGHLAFGLISEAVLEGLDLVS